MTRLQDRSLDLIVFGSLGDLAKRKLFPSLFALFQKKVLPTDLRIISVVRTEVTLEEFAIQTSEYLKSDGVENLQQAWQDFVKHIQVLQMELDAADDYKRLAKLFKDKDERVRVFYLAIPPSLFGPVAEHLGDKKCVTDITRVVVEKPLGHDLKSAKAINAQLSRTFKEEQTYRIDHYLGKETVQNIMALRFGNTILEPLWRNNRIEYIQITVAESLAIGSRAGYYDHTGALRDMVQNHLLQLLCIVAMEPPAQLNAFSVRDEKLKVLQSLRPIQSHDVVNQTIRGQYFDLHNKGEPCYRKEPGVKEDSSTETFVALKVMIDNWRWAGMPIYLRTGKCLKQQCSEIVIQFKTVPHKLFPNTSSMMFANRLVISLQPKETIKLLLNGKSPGRGMNLQPIVLNLDADSRANKTKQWDAYERLLLDVMEGDLTLFMRENDITAAWEWIDPILEGWEKTGQPALPYVANSWGPMEANQLLARDGYIWHNPDED